MKLVGQDALRRFSSKHANVRPWLDVWVRTVENATWQDIGEVRKAYPHADGVKTAGGRVVTVFNCKGNEFRLLCRVTYAIQAVQVLEVMTHAEYSKDLWKARY